MDSRGLLSTASRLLDGDPEDADVRRSVSTTYYALFHHLSACFGAVVLRPTSSAYTRAWVQAYRHIDHGSAKQRCLEVAKNRSGFPASIVTFADLFARAQDLRVEADYNPLAPLAVSDARTLINDATFAIASFDAEPPEAQRAFVLFVGLRPKR